MLTRLRVRGFKNLADVDIPFGPFTCVAGANGVGKSNLFDAILFLSQLADRPLLDAAAAIRGDGRAWDVRGLFHRVGMLHTDRMSFEVEMLVPAVGVDDLGQEARATFTFLRYALELVWRPEREAPGLSPMQVAREELTAFTRDEAREKLGAFGASRPWMDSVLRGPGRRGNQQGKAPFISTELGQASNGGGPTPTIIRLHQDGTGGRPRTLRADQLPRTVLSGANASESPTVLLARREMQSWRALQLEPSALRTPDSWQAPPRISSNGSHLAATVARLARVRPDMDGAPVGAPEVLASLAARLSELLEDVGAVVIDADSRRELYTLLVTDRLGTRHEARSLSDGTLRFLALAVLDLDPEAHGTLCLEEPENGFHPSRIPSLLALLDGLAADPSGVDSENLLRQIIINTHSPSVVAHVTDQDLIVASTKKVRADGTFAPVANFEWLHGTWRHRTLPDRRPVAPGKLAAYLGIRTASGPRSRGGVSVIDRDDLQWILPGTAD